MRKFSFLFAFLLSVMGVTQAWAFSITGPEILSSSDWSKESGRWNEWSGGIYDYAGGNNLSDTEIISPLLTHTSSNGVKITINGYNNGGSTSVLKVYYSTDKNNWYLAKDLSSDMNATTGSAVDMVADFPVEGNYYVKLVCNKVFIISFTAEDIVISPKTVYLAVNDSWKADNARFALYTKNEITNVETWVDFQAVEREYDIYSASVPLGTTLIIPCRMDPSTTENNWNNKWNQTQDITTITDNALYTISGWSYCTTGTFTPSTYTMTAVSEIAFGNMLGAATKTFTLTNSGTGILKNIIFATGEGVTIDNVPTELAAGANATISITLNAEGAYNDAMTISADYADDVTIMITGTNVVEEGKFYVDFRNSDIPKSWDNVSNDEVQFEMNSTGGGRNAYSTAALTLLTTSRLIVNEGDKFYFTAKRENSSTYYGDKLSVYYQTTEGTWESSTLISLSASDMSNSEYQVYTLENLPVGDIWLGFNGKYVHIQQMYGLTEPTKTVSLKPTNVWDLADANERYAVYMWKGDGAEKIEDWADFTAVEGVEGCYEATFNDAYTSIILARMNGAAEVNSWNNVWNQTEDVTGENFYDGAIYTITSIDGGNDGKSTYTLGGSTLALSENDEESMVVVGTYDEVTVEFTMGAGKFAAICLPFATTATALGEGVKVWEFTGFDGNINLETTTELAAATPYVIYAENGINGLTFQNVNIENAEAGNVVDGDAIFQGSYVKMPAGTMTGKYGVTPDGMIKKAGEGASMKAFRAYFEGITPNAKLACDGVIIGEATGIDTIENAELTGGLYDLQGRRVNNAQKGIYIQNGKKFVVK